MSNYEAWSRDGRFGLRISQQIQKQMLRFCEQAEKFETGGVLIGYLNRRHNCVLVTDCSGPPEDSMQGKRLFYRGVHGLQNWLSQLWHLHERRYYLGEWHFHPFASPYPSNTDVCQIKSNAESKSYHSPEVVMFIIGGDPKDRWTCSSFVYSQHEGLIELIRGWECNRIRV